MHTELKTYKNKNIGQFTSIPLKLSAGAVSDANLDSLYLATHFHKLRTQTVAHVRKSKHYATTLAAWQKKLKGVDVSDLAAVAKTLGLNVEVFNPLASASSESHKTLFSGGGRSSKRKAQLLKVKKGVFKPMKAEASELQSGGSAINKLMKGYRGLQKEPLHNITAIPDVDNPLVLHYILKGDLDSPFKNGVYYGQIKFHEDYPRKEPQIKMITPNGRGAKQVDMASMTHYYPESWNPTGDFQIP